MNCLCCGKKLKNESSEGWHASCIKHFFGTSVIPEIDINDKALEYIAVNNTNNGYTVPGVQKKISLHLHSDEAGSRLTLVNYPTGYILKPQISDFECLPEAEHLVMCMADATGISTVPHAILKKGNNLAYITKRIDRIIHKTDTIMLAMEDFCQLDLRLTADKYKGSYERCAKVIRQYSSQPGLDIAEMFIRIVFSYIIGNSDMHLKNFSLIQKATDSGFYLLSPAYDLLPVNLVMPEDREELALTINGKKSNIKRDDFLTFADTCGISAISAEKMISKIISMKKIYISMCKESLLPVHLKTAFTDLIENRYNTLQ